MNNLFVTNPIKINILSCTGNNDIYIEKLIVFIGKVPKNVKTELFHLEEYISKQYKKITKHAKNKNSVDDLKLEKKIKNKFPNIKKFYGNNWINRLGIDNIFHGKDIKGGQKDHLDEDIDFDFDSPIESDIDLDDLLQPVSSIIVDETPAMPAVPVVPVDISTVLSTVPSAVPIAGDASTVIVCKDLLFKVSFLISSKSTLNL